jgi:GTP-binding protein
MNWQNVEFVKSCASVNDLPADGLPQTVLAGRSNVGKSSVINALALRKNLARVGSAPGKTSQINFFRVDKRLYLADLPGYGYAKVSQAERQRWGRLMEDYFSVPERIGLGILVVDARHEPSALDLQMAEWFRRSGRPWVIVANKIDKVRPSGRETALTVVREALGAQERPLAAFSGETRAGRDELIQMIERVFPC